MAIYSTFFLAEPSSILAGFPGWKPPLSKPVKRNVINPFTREAFTIETRAPEWGDSEHDDNMTDERKVISGQGDYSTFLQERIPEYIQALPHWCAKGITAVELNPLVVVVTGDESLEMQDALYAPPSRNATLEELPCDFITHLKKADNHDLDSFAQTGATTLSTPDFTHSVSGQRLSEDVTPAEVLGILQSLTELAKQQREGQSMYLLTEA